MSGVEQGAAAEAASTSGVATDGAAVSRLLSGALRLVTTGLGLAVAVVLVAVVPQGWKWWAGGAVMGSVLVGQLGGRFDAFVPWGLVAAAIGVLLAATNDRLPVPTAVVIGLLVLVYLVVAELAGSEGRDEPGSRLAGLAGWLRTLSPVLGAGVVGSIVLAAVVELPIPPLAAVVVAAPIVLLGGVMVALSRRSRPR